MNAPTLTEPQKQLLQAQVIDDLQPGSILHDFQAVLDRVGACGVKVAGKYNLLPMELFPELDAKLHRPLQLALTMKRPQLRSHPYLHGLHLLLRASGLTRVEGSGARARLVIDPAALASWNGLHPTERYFNLLEAWLIFGRPEMIGEQGSRWDESFLKDCVHLWQFIKAVGKRWSTVGNYQGYLVALFDLFGLVEVTFPRKQVQPWAPISVKQRPFGVAVMTILEGEFERSRGWWLTNVGEPELRDEEDEEAYGFGAWQPLFQPYFPAWKNTLVLPEDEFREGVFIFRISLGKLWRRIAVAAESTLNGLVSVIIRAFDFASDHLHQFKYRDEFGATVTVTDPRMEEGPWTDEVQIGELPLTPGQSMDLLYDFGNNWHLDVKLEGIEPAGARRKLPQVIEKHGQAPKQCGYSDD